MNIRHIKIPINKIILLEENPRDISESDFEKLVKDIDRDREFFFQRPPLINLKDGKYLCYAGTQRVKAAIELTFDEVYCFVEENVPEKVQKQRMLKDNLHRGKWDKEKLFDLGFENTELEIMGFNDIDLNFFDEEEPEYPDDLTAPKKDNPPTIKLTFTSTKQMNQFEKKLNEVLKDFEDVTYSVSQGEL